MEDHAMEEKGDHLLVKLHGDVDLEHSVAVRKLLLNAVAKGRDLMIDLSDVTYLDSSGIASMIEAMHVARKNGAAFTLFSASDQVRRVFEMARLDKVFPLLPNLESALASRVGERAGADSNKQPASASRTRR